MPTYLPSQLFDAIRLGDATMVQEMVTANPIMLELRNERGTPPLTLASYLGKLNIVRILVDAGADLNVQDGSGTALMGVVFKGHGDVARYLIDAGADINASNAAGATALTYARMFSQQEMVDMLVSMNADPGRSLG